jgi:hypothetical protein
MTGIRQGKSTSFCEQKEAKKLCESGPGDWAPALHKPPGKILCWCGALATAANNPQHQI